MIPEGPIVLLNQGGGYMGMVPLGTNFWDVICVILSPQVPFVPRELIEIDFRWG